MLGQGVLLHLNDIAASGCGRVSVPDGQGPIYSHSCWCHFFVHQVRDNVTSAKNFPAERTFLVQKHLGLMVGLSQLVNNCLIRGGRLWPLSSQFPGLEVLSSPCLVLEQDRWGQCQLGLVGDSKMLFVPCL